MNNNNILRVLIDEQYENISEQDFREILIRKIEKITNEYKNRGILNLIDYCNATDDAFKQLLKQREMRKTTILIVTQQCIISTLSKSLHEASAYIFSSTRVNNVRKNDNNKSKRVRN